MGAAGQGPRGRAADLPGVLLSRVRGGHSLQTKRGRSSAERGGRCGRVGEVGGAAGQAGQEAREVPGGRCPPGPLLGKGGRL